MGQVSFDFAKAVAAAISFGRRPPFVSHNTMQSAPAFSAACQVASHFTKLVYFGGIIEQASTLDPVLAAVAITASMLGTTLARRILEAMSDAQFRPWANRLITTVAGYYILYGRWLLLTPHLESNALAF